MKPIVVGSLVYNVLMLVVLLFVMVKCIGLATVVVVGSELMLFSRECCVRFHVWLSCESRLVCFVCSL